MLKILLLAVVSAFLPGLSGASAAARVSFISGSEENRFLNVRAVPDGKCRIVPRKARRDPLEILQVTGNVGPEWKAFSVSFVSDKNAMVTMTLTSGKRDQWVEYTGFSAEGTRIDNGDFSRGEDFYWLWNAHPVSVSKGYCSANLTVGVTQSFRVVKDLPVTIRFKARSGQPRPRPEKQKSFDYNTYHKFPGAPLRFSSPQVKYLGLAHKGLSPESCPADALWYVKPRTAVSPTGFVSLPGKAEGRLDAPVELLEEDGISRNAPVRFGLPLAEGAFHHLGGLTVTGPDGRSVPAQFSAIAFWPDRSVKTALVQFVAPLKARERSLWRVRSGSGPAKSSPLVCCVTAEGGSVDTGKVKVSVARKEKFVTVADHDSSGRLILADEQGNDQIFVPEKISVEESGSVRATLRLEGRCGKSYRAVVRMGFVAGSPVISFDMRFINDLLDHEFTDITSLRLSFDNVPAREIVMDGVTGRDFFQYDDRQVRIDGKFSDRRLSGVGTAGNIRFSLADFWKKYPKAVTAAGQGIDFELLPRQPDENFGAGLPWYLRYPFCEGKYRTKWGTAFSEKLRIDFSGTADLAARDVVPAVDRDYVASCRVFQGVPEKDCKLFYLFDKRALEAFRKIEANRDEVREYGFLNWGDNFGERSVNWNNNEYDTARGLFLLFLRTGDRDVFRYAMAAARHQADVDIVHASLVKSVVGGQHQHGIGHNGPSWHHFRPKPWSYPHDANSTGLNGHTWSEGLLTAWCLAGDPFVMDSAQLMAAHFVNYIAPTYVNMRNNERSIGWALRAVMAFYRVTGEKKYLQAAKDMVDVALHEYCPAHGGAWPHPLKGQHAGGHKNAWGGCPFMVGVLLEGLRQYQLAARDPEVEEIIRQAARWLYKSYSPSDVGWPYGVSWDGKGYHDAFVQCNFEIVSGMLAGMPESYDVVCDVVGQAALGGISSTPKDFSMVLNMSGGILDGLRKTRPGEKGVIDGTRLWKRVAAAPSKFKLRGPVDKRFEVTVTGDAPEVVFRRTAYGRLLPASERTYTFTCGGRTETGDAAAHAVHTVRPPAKNGDRVVVDIHDGMFSYWDVESARDARVEAVVVPNFHIIAAGTKAYSFTVPAGTKSFSVTVLGVHRGGFAAAVLRPDGSIAGMTTGRNDGDVQLPWVKKSTAKRPEMTFRIDCSPEKDETWKLVLLSGGGVILSFDGIPPRIARIE